MIAAKPHKDYHELLGLLLERGMIINDRNRAIRKLSQVDIIDCQVFGTHQELLRQQIKVFRTEQTDFLLVPVSRRRTIYIFLTKNCVF